MTNKIDIAAETPPAGPQRRSLFRNLGLGLASAAAMGVAGTAGLGFSARPADATTGPVSDVGILNLALNLEYLEAEFYLRAVTGSGLPINSMYGGIAGQASGGSVVPFQNSAIAFMAQKIAVDEQAHVAFLRTALGSLAVPEPTIDLVNSFTTLAIAAGLIVPGQTFNPFASETNFLLGAYIFEDVGVTAYCGAASLLTVPANVAYAASIAAVEGVHSGAIRQRLSEIGGGAATDAISALRFKLGGVGDNGTNYNNNPSNITNVDSNGQAFRRTPSQVLSIVYGGGNSSGLFFPNGISGAFTSVT